MARVRSLAYWRDWGDKHRLSRIDFALFWERVGIVSLCQRLQVAYQVGTDPEFAARCFNAHTGTATVKAMCTILASPTLVVGFPEDA